MKKKIVYGRGTLVRDVEFQMPYWADNLFNGFAAKKLADLPPEMILSIHKGTASVKASKYPREHKELPAKGFVISIDKGTGLRIL